MKIGLLTFHNAHNFGAVLQCYSLLNVLKKYGKCEVINYDNKLLNYGLLSRYKGKRQRVLAFFKIFKLKKRFDNFEKFINSFPLTIKYSKEDLHNSPPEFDAIITGSDQIWNCTNYDSTYFASFPSNSRRISYGASFGKSEIPNELKANISNFLQKYEGISVREKTAKELLKKEFNIDVHEVVDPVFLTSRSHWEALSESYPIKRKFILVYLLEVSDIAACTIKKIKKETGLPVYALTTVFSGKNYGADFDIIDASPQQFLWLINNAEYVITSSFHGTCFSIIFEKIFYVIPKKDTGERVKDLLNGLNLLNRISTPNIDLNDINYSEVNPLLQNKINDAFEFLNNNLNDFERGE